MERNAHDSRLLLAVGQQRLELVDHGTVILLAGIAFANEERDIVDLHAIRNGKEFPRLDLHGVRLIVGVPIAAIDHALFCEDVERVVSLDESAAEPASRAVFARSLARSS